MKTEKVKEILCPCCGFTLNTGFRCSACGAKVYYNPVYGRHEVTHN